MVALGRPVLFAKLKEALIKFMKDSLEPAKRGDSIKPGVEPSETPGRGCGTEQKAYEVGDRDFIMSKF